MRRSSLVYLASVCTVLCLTVCSDKKSVSNENTETVLYEDVSTDHLPVDDLGGLSMDAFPADVDGDGDADIIIANEFRPNNLLLNDGSGRFTNASDRLPAANRDSEDVGVADFDGDGDLDIVIVSEDDQINELYFNDGAGRFTDEGGRLPVTGTSNAVLVADINLDGMPDILIGNNGQNVILINNGGSFTDETSARLPARTDVTQDIELGDADGDGDLDLLVGNEDRNRLLMNNGQGIFTDESDTRIPLRPSDEETREADFGDVDGDGDLDIFFANVQTFVGNADPQNRLLINDGSGIYTDETASRLPTDSDRAFDGDFLDLDHDGDLDIATANLNRNLQDGRFRVYVNDGTGKFIEATSAFFPAGTTGAGLDIECADFNGDGQKDLYLAGRGTTDRLLLSKGIKSE